MARACLGVLFLLKSSSNDSMAGPQGPRRLEQDAGVRCIMTMQDEPRKARFKQEHMCMRIYIYMRMCTYTLSCTYIYKCVTYVYALLCIWMYIYIYMHTYMYILGCSRKPGKYYHFYHLQMQSEQNERWFEKWSSISIYTYIRIYTYIYIYVNIHAYTCICIHIYTYMYMYIHIYTCITHAIMYVWRVLPRLSRPCGTARVSAPKFPWAGLVASAHLPQSTGVCIMRAIQDGFKNILCF